MLSYYLKCIKNTESKNLKAARTRNRRIMSFSKCAMRNNKKSKFIKQQEASGFLSSLGIKTTSNKIRLVGRLSFYRH